MKFLSKWWPRDEVQQLVLVIKVFKVLSTLAVIALLAYDAILYFWPHLIPPWLILR